MQRNSPFPVSNMSGEGTLDPTDSRQVLEKLWERNVHGGRLFQKKIVSTVSSPFWLIKERKQALNSY